MSGVTKKFFADAQVQMFVDWGYSWIVVSISFKSLNWFDKTNQNV